MCNIGLQPLAGCPSTRVRVRLQVFQFGGLHKSSGDFVNCTIRKMILLEYSTNLLVSVLMVCSLSEETWASQPGSPHQMNYCERTRTHIGKDPFNKSRYVYWLVITAVSTMTEGVKMGNGNSQIPHSYVASSIITD